MTDPLEPSAPRVKLRFGLRSVRLRDALLVRIALLQGIREPRSQDFASLTPDHSLSLAVEWWTDVTSAIPHDLKALERRAWILDAAYRVPGTNRRIGLSALIGLVPGIGDAAGSLLGMRILIAALKHRVTAPRVAQMLINSIMDVLIGSIPVVGDLIDLAFHENRRNMELLITYRDSTKAAREPAEIAVLLALVSIPMCITYLLAISIAIEAVVALLSLFV